VAYDLFDEMKERYFPGRTDRMKMLIIVYSDVVDEELVAALKKAGVSGYTKWKETLGEGPGRGPNWPRTSGPQEQRHRRCCERRRTSHGFGFLRDLKGSHPKGGIKTFILTVEGTI
jgi:hypothetical protein